MIILKKFSFEGDKFYSQRTVMPLDLGGLSLFRGHNYDACPEGNVSNGTAKTRLPQILENFIFGRSERGTFKRSILEHFDGTLEFYDTRTKTEWSFNYSLAKDRWTILKNGESPDYISHKSSDRQAKLQELIGYTRDEWNHYVHVNQNSVSILLNGKPAQRRLYLENFFNIDAFYEEQKEDFDRKCSRVDEQIELLKEDKIKQQAIQETLRKSNGIKWLEYQLEFLPEVVAHLKKGLAEARQEQSVLSQSLEVWREYQGLFLLCQGANLEQTKAKHQALVERQSELKLKIARQKTLKDLIRNELEPHLKRRPPPVAPADNLLPEPSPGLLAEKELAVAKMREKLGLKKAIRALNEQLEELPPPLSGYDEVKHQKLLERQATLKHHLDLLDKGEGHCPTCGQELPSLLPGGQGGKAQEELLAGELGRINKFLKELEGHKKLERERTRLKDQLSLLEQRASEFPNFGVKLSVAEEELAELKRAALGWEEYHKNSRVFEKWENETKRIEALLAGAGYPDDSLEKDYTVDLSNGRVLIAEAEEELSKLTKYQELSSTVATYPYKSLPLLQAAVEQSLELIGEYEQNLANLNILFGELRQEYVKLKEKNAELSVINDRLARWDDLMAESRILESLAKFFSPSGFKLYELKRRSQLLIERANYWSHFFFQEPYLWSMPDDLEALDFLVQPVNKRGAITTPTDDPYSAALLSAGERNRAAQVLLFSQLQLTPPNKRMNLLFLDEVEANLDAAGFRAFMDVALPKLKETFPERTIVIISHQNSLKTASYIDHLWLAERRDRKTSLTVYPWYQRRV